MTHTWNLCSAFNPSKCTHTAVSSEQTHTHHEHTPGAVGSHIAAAPGEQLGVRCLAQGSHLSRGIKGGREHWLFTPPTDNSCRTWDSNPQPSGYKSDSLSISCPKNGEDHYKWLNWTIMNYDVHIKPNFRLIEVTNTVLKASN